MNVKSIAGIALAAVGLLILAGFVPLTTVVYAGEEAVISAVPAGSLSSPTYYSPETQQLISLRVMIYDKASGISLPGADSMNDWKVSVTVSPGDQAIDMGRYARRELIGTLSNPSTIYYVWEKLWNVPNTPNTTYTFNWKVEVRDSTGKILNTLTKTTYAKVSSIDPDGTFELNGQPVTTESTVFVTSPSLTIRFSPTSGASNVKEIRVEVLRGSDKVTSVILTRQNDDSYAGSVELPEYGAYTVRGYIITNQNQVLLKMTTVVGTDPGGDGTIDEPSGQSQNVINKAEMTRILIGASAIGLGLLILSTGRRR